MDSESSASRRNFAFRSIAARIEERGTITRLQLRGWNSYDDSRSRVPRTEQNKGNLEGEGLERVPSGGTAKERD